MVTHSHKWLWMALLLSTIAADGARGQWRIVATKAVLPFSSWGAVYFNNGIMWAGGQNLVFSEDSGKTWKTSSLPTAAESVTGISFFTKDTGVVITGTAGIYLTCDRGKTWTNPSTLGGWDVAYGNSTSSISATGGLFQTSTDGGMSWAKSTFAPFMFGLTATKNGTLYASGGQEVAPGTREGNVYSSINQGASWVSSASAIDVDSYSLSVDPCDSTWIYVANENWAWSGDGFSKLYYSSDGGMTWNVGFSHSTVYLSGSISESAHALFAQTIPDGILRSTDRGISWVSISGPSQHGDCRDVFAINDNIIIALDSAGNIWETSNCGGDSVLESRQFSAIPALLFQNDTIRCDSLTRTVMFTRIGCNPPSVTSCSIIGLDSASYRIIKRSNDSVLVSLSSIELGNKHAQLIIFLDNGKSDTVSLAGVNISTNFLSLSTEDVKTDTLGATVAVPITINGLERPEDVDLVLHYDGTVDYLGSFSPSGAKLDIPGEQWAGRSELHIAGAAPGAVAGYSKFNVFNDSSESAHAMFDALTVLTAKSPCEYSMPEAVTSTITAPSGCGATILSQLIHLGVEPRFSVRPNPANGDVWISSSVDLRDVTFAIYDMLGSERSEIMASVEKNAPVELALPQAEGVYNIVAKYSSGTSMMRVVREHY